MRLKIKEPKKTTLADREVEIHDTFAVFRYPREAINEYVRQGIFPQWVKEIAKSMKEALGMEVVMVSEDVKIEVCELTEEEHEARRMVWRAQDEREARRTLWKNIIERTATEQPDGIDLETLYEWAKQDGFEKSEIS